MLNLILSFVVTLVSVVWSVVSYMKGPLAIGLIVGAVILSFNPAHAAEIQCNMSDCSMLTSHWYDLIIERKAAVILGVVGVCIGLFLALTDKGEV